MDSSDIYERGAASKRIQSSGIFPPPAPQAIEDTRYYSRFREGGLQAQLGHHQKRLHNAVADSSDREHRIKQDGPKGRPFRVQMTGTASSDGRLGSCRYV